jgi:hypothetical protein
MGWVFADAAKVCGNQGTRTITSVSPPTVIYVDENEDFSGWQKKPRCCGGGKEGFGNGSCNRRLELQAADDCTFESFLF